MSKVYATFKKGTTLEEHDRYSEFVIKLRNALLDNPDEIILLKQEVENGKESLTIKVTYKI